jgi:peptidyl-prolyl cis-trans isomerase C
VPITSDDVQAVARAEGIGDPRAALDRAITLRVLANEAKRRGLDRDPLVADTERRAMVQAVLSLEVEATVPAEPLPAADLAAGMRIRGFELSHGELWHVHHVLVQAPRGAPPAAREALRARAEEIRRRLDALPPDARVAQLQVVMRAVCGRSGCRFENLPPFDHEGRYPQGDMLPAFAQAAASLTNPGDLAPVVETEFGAHVIVLVERLPAEERPASEVEATVHQELLAHLRHRRLDELLSALRTRFGGNVSDAALREAERIDVTGARP